MSQLASWHEQRESVVSIATPTHDLGDAPLPTLQWAAQPRPVGDPRGPGGADARLSGVVQLGPVPLYVELVEVGYTPDGCQEFIAEQAVGLDECEETCGPDIHRALGGSAAETFVWKGREYAMIIVPYSR